MIGLNLEPKWACSLQCHLSRLGIFGTTSEQASPERRPLDTEAVESSAGTDQGATPKKARKKKAEK